MPDATGGNAPPQTVADVIDERRRAFIDAAAPHLEANEEAIVAAFDAAVDPLFFLLQITTKALADTADDNARNREALAAARVECTAAVEAAIAIVHKAGGVILITREDAVAVPPNTALEYHENGRDFRVVTRQLETKN